jgi:lipopolysaccharide export system protein LptA
MLSPIYEGDTFVMPVTIASPSGVPIDLTGSTIDFCFGTSGNYVTEMSDGVSVIRDDTQGKVEIEINADTMEAKYPKGRYSVWVKITYTNGRRDTEISLTQTINGGMPCG